MNRQNIHPGTALLAAVFLLMGSFAMMAGCAQEPSQPAEEMPPAEEQHGDPIASGKASYDQYCQSCHGTDGKGAGEIAADLDTPPSDLTQLRGLNNGTFPQDSIYAMIEGNADVAAHGPRQMPVWGNIWGEEGGEPVADEIVAQRINELVEYIRSIQE